MLSLSNFKVKGSATASHGLRGECYFSNQVLEREYEALWHQTWQLVGRESDLVEVGNYFTCTVGTQPILVIRSQTGIEAMYNVCPHRGARLLEGQGHCHQIRCPYHSWSFACDGTLQGLPQADCFPHLDRSTVALAKVRVETWGGFVFVNLAANGESLQTYLAGFGNYLRHYDHDWENLRQVDHWDYEHAVNWKFFVENYLESYHLSTVHGQSLKCFDPKQIQTAANGRHYQICVGYRTNSEVHPSFVGGEDSYSYQGFIFPNWMVNTAKDNVSIFRVTPLAAERTRFEVFIYQTPAQSQQFPYCSEQFRPPFDQVLQEDFAAVHLLQASVRSQAYGVLQFAEPLEQGIQHFHAVWSSSLQMKTLQIDSLHRNSEVIECEL
jgi:phenylpropionate dioxygenase-like ring-hydroxylating dioxygenase large terminal subunit